MSTILCLICHEELTVSKSKPSRSGSSSSRRLQTSSPTGHLVSTICGHIYHSSCLKKWFKEQRKSNIDYFREDHENDSSDEDEYMDELLLLELRKKISCPICNNQIKEEECHRVFLSEEHAAEKPSSKNRGIQTDLGITSAPVGFLDTRKIHEENEKLKKELFKCKEGFNFLRCKMEDLKLEQSSTMSRLMSLRLRNRVLTEDLEKEREKNLTKQQQAIPEADRSNQEEGKKEQPVIVKRFVKTEWTVVQRPRKSKNWWQRFYNIYLSPGGRDY